MALIKHAKSDRLLKDAIVLDMSDLAQQARRMLDNARAEAQRIVEQGKAEAQQLIDSADEGGYAQGFERGMAEGREAGEREGREQALQQHAQQLATLTQQWTASLEQWESQREAMFHDAAEDVIRFAFLLARKVTHRVIESDPTVVRDQLAEALKLLSRPSAVEVVVNPEDRAMAEHVLPELASTIARCEHVALREDASIARGGCVIATAGGRIDATIETQLDRIAEALVPMPASTQDGDESDGEDAGPSANLDTTDDA